MLCTWDTNIKPIMSRFLSSFSLKKEFKTCSVKIKHLNGAITYLIILYFDDSYGIVLWGDSHTLLADPHPWKISLVQTRIVRMKMMKYFQYYWMKLVYGLVQLNGPLTTRQL